MNIRVFEYILAVNELSNFHLAAAKCKVSQPALSSAIKIFEQEIGIKIFSRTTRRVSPTAAGLNIIEQVRTIQSEIKALAELANYHAEVSNTPIKIAFDSSLSLLTLPNILPALEKRLSSVKIEIYEETIAAAKNKLVNNLVDVVIAPHINLQGSGLISEEMFKEPILICLPKGHDLCSKKSISVKDLLAYRLVLPKLTDSIYNDMMRSVLPDLSGADKIEAQTLDGVAMMINARMGVGFVPAGMLSKISEHDLIVRKSTEKLSRSIHMIWRANEVRTHSLGHIRRAIASTNLFNTIIS